MYFSCHVCRLGYTITSTISRWNKNELEDGMFVLLLPSSQLPNKNTNHNSNSRQKYHNTPIPVEIEEQHPEEEDDIEDQVQGKKLDFSSPSVDNTISNVIDLTDLSPPPKKNRSKEKETLRRLLAVRITPIQ